VKRRMLSPIVVFATGCGQVDHVSPPIILSQRTVTVSGNDPFINMADGTRIPVDGVAPGASSQLMVTEYQDSNGKVLVDVDSVTESTRP
jgi:hypothetical protein